MARPARSLLVLAVLVAATTGSGILVPEFPPVPPRHAVVIDQVAATHPDPTWSSEVHRLLIEAGFTVDWYTGDAVDPEVFDRARGSAPGLLVLRMHAAAHSSSGRSVEPVLFTNAPAPVEPLGPAPSGLLRVAYDGDRVAASREPVERAWWGVTPGHLGAQDAPRWPGTVVLAGGCETAAGGALAQAFRSGGAAAFVGWTVPVTVAQNDAMLRGVLQVLVEEGATLGDAMQRGTDTTQIDRLEIAPAAASRLQPGWT